MPSSSHHSQCCSVECVQGLMTDIVILLSQECFNSEEALEQRPCTHSHNSHWWKPFHFPYLNFLKPSNPTFLINQSQAIPQLLYAPHENTHTCIHMPTTVEHTFWQLFLLMHLRIQKFYSHLCIWSLLKHSTQNYAVTYNNNQKAESSWEEGNKC